MKKTTAFFLIALSFYSCGILEDNGVDDPGPDIAQGLKEALRVGTDTATKKLAITDGYLKDQAVKILLPDEMEEAINNFKSIEIDVFGVSSFSGEEIYSTGIPLLGISSLADIEDELIMGINRAAESAASEAGPIFFDAITGITIADANSILFGEDDAATVYLKDNTFDALFDTYEPKINTAIANVKVGETSVEDLYASFVTNYNDILSKEIPTGLLSTQSFADLAGLEALDQPDLSAFATEKGLDGLFLKIEEEEANIRENPFARVTDILEEVFGLLDD